VLIATTTLIQTASRYIHHVRYLAAGDRTLTVIHYVDTRVHPVPEEPRVQSDRLLAHSRLFRGDWL
jgi:hypothetical protein